MNSTDFSKIPWEKIPTPCTLADEKKLMQNGEILNRIRKESGVVMLLALKAFAGFSLFPLLRNYLDGVTASSLNEAKLGKKEFQKEVHSYQVAYREDEFDQILELSDHIVFNSLSQWQKFKDKIHSTQKNIRCGLRVNPEIAEVQTEIYNPCSAFSRLGVTAAEMDSELMEGIEGLHVHALCENGADSLEQLLLALENNFASSLEQVNWVNLGGGHHFTNPNYDVNKAITLLKEFKKKHHVQLIIEPGEAVVLNAGYLVASVLDIVRNKMDIAILDVSASAHMPDVLEMPYHPEILGAHLADSSTEQKYAIRLAGNTCLAGDVIGNYSFDHPLQIGERIVFADMLHYSTVKNTTFNGVNLPSLGMWSKENQFRQLKEFGYEDYKSRLG